MNFNLRIIEQGQEKHILSKKLTLQELSSIVQQIRKTLKFSIVSPSPTPDGGLRFSFDIITLPCLGSNSLQEVFLV